MRIFVNYKAKQGKREGFLDYVLSSGTLEKIKNEDGCILYNYYFDALDKDTILLIEEWKNEECQKRHLSSPHMKELLEKKKEYIDSTEIL